MRLRRRLHQSKPAARSRPRIHRRGVLGGSAPRRSSGDHRLHTRNASPTNRQSDGPMSARQNTTTSHSPFFSGVRSILHAITPGAVATRSKLRTSCLPRSSAASRASPQPMSVTTALEGAPQLRNHIIERVPRPAPRLLPESPVVGLGELRLAWNLKISPPFVYSASLRDRKRHPPARSLSASEPLDFLACGFAGARFSRAWLVGGLFAALFSFVFAHLRCEWVASMRARTGRSRRRRSCVSRSL